MTGSMKLISHAPGAPLELSQAPIPAPGEGQILIKAAAAGMNRPDLLQREGRYPPPPGAPETLGLEVAGTVKALGQGVTRWKVGDQVCALLGGGGYAEYALAYEGSALPAPKSLSLTEAAGLPETVFTVWANVFEAGGLQPGETVLIHGGASGIGTTAIQMAKAHGARVFVTAGSAEKCAACEKLGADRAINYKTEDFEAILREAGGADVILDMVGAPYLAKNINAAKPLARIVSIAQLEGATAEINLMLIMLKRLTLTGSTLRSRAVAEKARIAREVERHVWPWIEAGKFKPVIDTVFPLGEAETAMQRLASSAHIGKLVLKM
jgi:putative PIG3 family NAD(P)H quinone oxidoreductase